MPTVIQIYGDLSSQDCDFISSALGGYFDIAFGDVANDTLQRVEEKLDLLLEDVSQILIMNKTPSPGYTVGTKS